MAKIEEYTLSPEAMVMISGSSIGTQKKFYEKGFWYKQNNIGYEGQAEYLASIVLSCSNISEYVVYERCKINGRDGCRSQNFLNEGETYISLQRLYDTYYGGQLSERIRLIDTVKERIQYVINYVHEVTNFDIKRQLALILTFDMLILNTDRHFNNIGIIADTCHSIYKNAPVFDNGNSLLSNVSEFSFEKPIRRHIENVIGQPFSSNLERQAWELGFGFKVNYQELQTRLQKEPDSRAMEVLQSQLNRYEGIIKDNFMQIKSSSLPVPSLLDKLHDYQTELNDQKIQEKKSQIAEKNR